MSNPIPEIITPQTDAPEEQKNNASSPQPTKLYGLKTLKTDAAEVEKQGRISLTSLAAKQNRVESTANVPATSSYKKIILISAAFLLLSSLSAFGWFLFFGQKQNSGSKQVNPPYPTPLIVAQKEETLIAGSLGDLKNKMSQAAEQTYYSGDLVYFAVKKSSDSSENYLNTENFLAMLNKERIGTLPFFLENKFFLGIISLAKNHPILVFEAKKGQYERTFGAMLAWEKTMPSDLNPVFNTAFPENKTSLFKDRLIKNNAVRIYESENGSNLLYTIFNRKYIIIADSSEALEETIRRFMLFKLS